VAFVIRSRRNAVGFRRNAGPESKVRKQGTEGVAVIRLIGENGAGGHTLDESRRPVMGSFRGTLVGREGGGFSMHYDLGVTVPVSLANGFPGYQEETYSGSSYMEPAIEHTVLRAGERTYSLRLTPGVPDGRKPPGVDVSIRRDAADTATPLTRNYLLKLACQESDGTVNEISLVTSTSEIEVRGMMGLLKLASHTAPGIGSLKAILEETKGEGLRIAYQMGSRRLMPTDGGGFQFDEEGASGALPLELGKAVPFLQVDDRSSSLSISAVSEPAPE
jgi:hypothetical protein